MAPLAAGGLFGSTISEDFRERLAFSLRLFQMETLQESKRNRLIEGTLNARVSSPESEINAVIEEEQLALTCLSCAL